jgi:hypothetical protein
MMNYILRNPASFDDVEFLNSTSHDYELFNPNLLSDNDSGWCDMSTGGRILTNSDRIIFRNVSPQQFTLLKLKYQDRLKSLTSDIKEIYNEAEQHNVSPLTVVDSETII